jgi:UDP-N-acetylbacillosamine alanyltransferase
MTFFNNTIDTASAKPPLLDSALFDPNYLNAVYGSLWRAFEFSAGEHLFRHIALRMPIADTGYFFSDPWRGYFDPYSSTYNTEFLQKAFAAYREWCFSQRIIGEFMRLNPVGGLYDVLEGIDGAYRSTGQMVTMLPAPLDGDSYFAALQPACRRILRRARERYNIRTASPETPELLEAAQSMHARSLRRSGAFNKWFVSLNDLRGLASLREIEILVAQQKCDGRTVGMTCTVYGQATVQVILVGIEDNAQSPGACDLLYLTLMEHAAERARGAEIRPWVSLGGGRGMTANDGLIRFKAKYSLGQTYCARYAVLVNDAVAVARLTDAANPVGEAPSDPSSQLKIKHFGFLHTWKVIDERG